MKKNICFISIFDLTKVYYEMALRLEQYGHQCFWMTTNPEWTTWLVSRGVKREAIIELVFTEEDFLCNSEKTNIIHEITETESVASRTVNLCLMADRFVMGGNRYDISDYVLLYYQHVKRYLVEKSIDIVFGEPTNTNEMIAELLCQQLGIYFLSPQSLRFPTNRFFFGLGVGTGVMTSSGNGQSAESANVIIERFRESHTHPAYFYLHNHKTLNIRKNLRSIHNRLKNSFIPKHHLTHHRFIGRLLLKLRKTINSIYLTHLYRYDELDKIHGKIAFFGLHVQPEASIDVMGPFFSDQLKLVKDIRRSLPFDTTLVIKEHRNFLGAKPLSFFYELSSMPNVKLVSPYVSTFDIYKRASLVLTISGTTAYEAGLLGIPAITFAKMFFSGFSSVYYCSDITQLKPLAFRLLIGFNPNKDADEIFMAQILRNSYPGYWTDPLTDPSVMDSVNLESLFAGFQDVLEAIDSVGTPMFQAINT